MLVKSQKNQLEKWMGIREVGDCVRTCAAFPECASRFGVLVRKLYRFVDNPMHASDLAHWLVSAYLAAENDDYRKRLAAKIYGEDSSAEGRDLPVAITLHKPARCMSNGVRYQSMQWRRFHAEDGTSTKSGMHLYSHNSQDYFAIHADCILEMELYRDMNSRQHIWWAWDHYGFESPRQYPA